MDVLKARLSFDAVAYDYDDEYLTIDTDTHTININNVSRLFGVQYDGNSKLIKFKIRNKLSDIQKMQDSIVYINWIDSRGVKGQSIAINKTINNDTCEFAWKVPFDALKNSGVLHFAMSAVMTKNSSSVINQKWSTQIASVTTPDGIYIKSYTPSSEEEDRIAQIYNELSNMINKQNDNLQSQVNSLKEDIDNKILNDEYMFGENMDLLFEGYQRNLINKFTIKSNLYISYIDGEEHQLQGSYASDFIEVIGGQNYTSNLHDQCAWYDESKKFISGLVKSYGTNVAPQNAKYFRTTINSESLNTMFFTEGNKIETKKIRKINEDYYTTVFKVGKGTYGSLKSALKDCVNPSETNKYLIEVYTDDNIALTREELNDTSFVGLFVPNWVKIIGMGDRRQFKISLKIDENETEETKLRISTLNLQQNSELENLTIIGENCRYAVHDDFEGITDIERHITNCKVISRNTISHVAWGSGYRSGLKWFFENCVFVNEESQGVPFASHNNRGFEKPATLTFINCRFLGGENGGCARFGSINTGYTNIVNQLLFYGNKVSKIYLTETDPTTYGKGIKVTVSGYGNTCTNNDVIVSNTDDVNYSDYVDLI